MPDGPIHRRGFVSACVLATVSILGAAATLPGEPVAVRYVEGVVHGTLAKSFVF